ncbi:MAG: VOC family protein [Saprospiraceae bacterium]
MKNAINWFEIQTLDLDRAIQFYSTILGVELQKTEAMGESICMFPFEWNGGVGGSLVQRADTKPSTDGTMVLLNADGKLDEVVARIGAAGGQVLAPRIPIGNNGFIALFIDSEGNKVGLHSFT